jgi:hypothetical protein
VEQWLGILSNMLCQGVTVSSREYLARPLSTPSLGRPGLCAPLFGL